MRFNYLKQKQDLSLILISIIFYLLIQHFFRLDIIGYWESVSVYSSLKPSSNPILGNIQIAADTTGGHGLGYPLILLSAYISKFFTLSFSSLKYIFLFYSIIFIIFYYYSIKHFINSFVAFSSIILLILNPYFLYMSPMIISQSFTLALIFFNIFLFTKFENDKSKTIYFLLSISISLLLMNYILGRYVLLIVIIYFFLKDILQNSFNKDIFINNIFLYSKLIILSLIILCVIFPPNIGILFSKNLFFPFTTLQQGGEVVLYESRILEIIYLNIQHVIYTYFLGGNFNYGFNLINSESVNFFPLISIIFLLIGYFTALKKKTLNLFILIFITLFTLIILSNSIIEDGKLIGTSISVYRMYILVPIMTIFICYGIQEISQHFFKKSKQNQLFKILAILTLLLVSFYNIFKSENSYENIKKIYLTKNSFYENIFDKSDKNYELRIALDYHMKIRTLSTKFINYLESKENDKTNPQYIYLKLNKDLNFIKYPPRLKNDKITKYSKHIFFTLYFNDIGDETYTFLYNTKDEINLLKKMDQYSRIQEKKLENSMEKIIAKKIINLFDHLIDFKKENETYEVYKVNFNKNFKRIILYNEEEYFFVKNKLGIEPITINVSEFFSEKK